jgi:small subunit ribosomal protein S1
MALKRNPQPDKNPIHLDESWWTAVLEDIETRYAQKTQRMSDLHKTPKTDSTEETVAKKEDKASEDIDWEWVKQLYEQDRVVKLEVADHNRGGLLVYGEKIQGFVPASHLVGLSPDPPYQNRDESLTPYVGRSIKLKVIECDSERGRIVFSERAAQTEDGSRLELLNTLEVGDQRTGHVTTITDFGVFIDLGGVEGLIHISELSWGRVCHPGDILSIGDEIKVYVLQVDQEKSRVALSVKRLLPNPWETVHARYQTGQTAKAIITNIVSFGAFARLEDGLDGLIHVSELGDKVTTHDMREMLSEGQEVNVCILHIDSNRQRLGLSLATDGDGVN